MIYDLQAYKKPADFVDMYIQFWSAWFDMFVPRVRVSAKIYTFPVKAPKP